MQQDRILITGGAGFIGSHLTEGLLAHDMEVAVLDNLSAGKRGNVPPEAKFYECDMNEAKVKNIFQEFKPTYVYHLAFNTDAPRSVREPVHDAFSISGSIRIFEESVAHKVKKVIFTSSGFIYGNTKIYPTSEDQPPIPSSPYSVSKFATEEYLRYFHLNYGLPYTILRFSTIYGPRQLGRAMDYYLSCIRDNQRPNIWGDGTKTRDYVYVADAVKALLAAKEFSSYQIEPIFNIACSRETQLNELYALLAKLLGRSAPPPQYLEDRPGEMMRLCLNSKKAKKYLQWRPETTLEEGLARTFPFYFGDKKQ
jgi:UDP-glucose 4-epimerase